MATGAPCAANSNAKMATFAVVLVRSSSSPPIHQPDHDAFTAPHSAHKRRSSPNLKYQSTHRPLVRDHSVTLGTRGPMALPTSGPLSCASHSRAYSRLHVPNLKYRQPPAGVTAPPSTHCADAGESVCPGPARRPRTLASTIVTAADLSVGEDDVCTHWSSKSRSFGFS